MGLLASAEYTPISFERTIQHWYGLLLWTLRCLHSLYKGDPLQAKLREVFRAETTLEPSNLRTLLLVVARNAVAWSGEYK
jgi:hypothetical protein